jgi:hypothetical protein
VWDPKYSKYPIRVYLRFLIYEVCTNFVVFTDASGIWSVAYDEMSRRRVEVMSLDAQISYIT